MFKNENEMLLDVKETMRGGDGKTKILNIFSPDELKGKSRLFAKVTLDPGSSIGNHVHDNEEEIYYVLSGSGTVEDNGVIKPFGPGDALKTGGGENHSIRNTGTEPLVFMAVILLFE